MEENDQVVDETTNLPEEVAEQVPEKPMLTPEQQRGILLRKLNKINKELGIEEPPKEVKESSRSNEPDYAKEAYLETKGYSHPDDKKIIYDEAQRLKMPLGDVIGMEHIKARLASVKDQREAQAGMPKGKGSAGGYTQQDVDYWLAKGETPDDQALAEKVISARIKQETDRSKFSDTLYT